MNQSKPGMSRDSYLFFRFYFQGAPGLARKQEQI